MRPLSAKQIIAFALVAGWTLYSGAFAQQPATDGQNKATAKPASTRIDFGRDIRPILSDKCFVCHGPDAVNNKSKLRFDTEAHAFADLGNGRHAIVRGDPQQSQLVRRITAENAALRMPPAYSPLKLSKQDIDRLTQWIAQGAPWRQHWAFIPPVRPEAPEVKNRAWPKNPIDSFVLARLEKEGLEPSPEADRPTLIRRLSFDLTGLPPTIQE